MAVACTVANETGSSGSLSEPFLDVTATWEGTWESTGKLTGESGTIVIVFVQDLDSRTSEGVSKVTATTEMTTTTVVTSDCFDTGDGLSVVDFVQLTGDLILIPGGFVDGKFIFPQQLSVVLDILGNDMVGTYRVASHIFGSACLGDVGTITATRN
ncbi:MAG: hypothetical protein IH881_16465 [Myxococcales bacterium]|nr:hypothetical protein [Myxococcales bacterium]